MNRVKASVVLAGLFVLMILPGCKEKPKNPVAEYGDKVINTYKGAQTAADIATLNGLKKSVEAYRAANGSYPAELKDVSDLMGGPVDFSKYDYDPVAGKVTLKALK